MVSVERSRRNDNRRSIIRYFRVIVGLGVGGKFSITRGLPVQEYEPFCDNTHMFAFGIKFGVSSFRFSDPLGRVAAIIHPKHTWIKSVFGVWNNRIYDENDTVLMDPKTDLDVGEYFQGFSEEKFLPTWYDARIDGQMGSEEKLAAESTSLHADTPQTTYLDPLGRTFLTVDDNATAGQYSTQAVLDIHGNQEEINDAKGRVILQQQRNMLGTVPYESSMEAGERWMLNDITGSQLIRWDSRRNRIRY